LAIAHNLRKIARNELKNVAESAFINTSFTILKKFVSILTHVLLRQKYFPLPQIIRDYSPVYGGF
jgi:hypothetical protein